ncbi:uncharacterized protein LOC131303109 [Rhododendron vialii]|uniref:uncharacterized protein LOC131303109 n=1 Tax=Rhododendron vialii TaxID=182163 RepID=UPI00265F12B9|nr:uncharacterized protein LOC131303109 [Rhododendron vialii]
MLVVDVVDKRNGTWNRQKLVREVPFEVVEAILKIPLPLVDRQDQLVWHYDKKGVCSVKSGYQVAMQSNLNLRNEKAESSFKPKECSWAQAVWFACSIKVYGDLGGNASVLKWAADMVDKMTFSEATEFMGFVALIAWYIWKMRNNFVFRNIRIDPRDTLAAINHAHMETTFILEIPNVHTDTPLTQEDISTWRAPDRGHFKEIVMLPFPKEEGKVN